MAHELGLQRPQHLAETPDIPLGSRDRVYTADQTSNTLSVYDPSSNRLVGVLRLGDVTPQNLSPLYSRGRIIAGRGHWSRVPPDAVRRYEIHLAFSTAGVPRGVN
jgi:hypothetical protein